MIKRLLIIMSCSLLFISGCSQKKIYVYEDGTTKTEKQIKSEQFEMQKQKQEQNNNRFIKTGNVYEIDNGPNEADYYLTEVKDTNTDKIYVILSGNGWTSGMCSIE